jgi:hypothetical protein
LWLAYKLWARRWPGWTSCFSGGAWFRCRTGPRWSSGPRSIALARPGNDLWTLRSGRPALLLTG